MKIFAIIVQITLILLAFASVSRAQTRSLDLGGVVILVSDSRTAQVFHIVDQLSQWDNSTHQHYVRWAAKKLNLNQEDQKLLQKHADLRRARGWGQGFEQAFYVDDSIENAAKRAVESKLISAAEADSEKTILAHFDPILAGTLDQSAPRISAFEERLTAEAKKIAPLVQRLLRFSETKDTIKVPLFLVSNPEEGNGGGGYNGERLVVEIEDKPDPLPVLLHECLHALLWRHREAIEVAADSLGLNWEVLNEGIAHAFSPGLTDDLHEADTLSERLVRNALASDSGVKKYLVAVLIRPLLRSALDHEETFTSFLPKAVDKLRAFNWR